MIRSYYERVISCINAAYLAVEYDGKLYAFISDGGWGIESKIFSLEEAELIDDGWTHFECVKRIHHPLDQRDLVKRIAPNMKYDLLGRGKLIDNDISFSLQETTGEHRSVLISYIDFRHPIRYISSHGQQYIAVFGISESDIVSIRIPDYYKNRNINNSMPVQKPAHDISSEMSLADSIRATLAENKRKDEERRKFIEGILNNSK